MEVETEGVRVMTVHASKGLEAPIVFLPDTCGAPHARHEPKLMRLVPAKPPSPPLYAWAKAASGDGGRGRGGAVASARERGRASIGACSMSR